MTMIGSLAAPASAAPQSPEIPADLVDALQRDLKIDAQQYLTRIRTAEQLTAFAATARVAHPNAFAGVRMDGDRGIVALSEGVSAAAARKAAQQAGFAVETVADSEATLRGRRTAFEQWLAHQSSAIAQSVVGYGIDVVHNSLTVRVAQGTQLPSEAGRIRSITAVVPVARPSTTDAAGPAPLEGTGAEAVIGGQPFAFDYYGRTGKCSFGFNGTDAAGHAVNITAGHCNPDNLVPEADKSPQPRHVFETAVDAHDKRRGADLGYFETSNLGPHDFSVIRIGDAAAGRFRNNMITTRRITVPGPLSAGSAAGLHLPTSSSEGSAGAPPNAPDIRIDGTMDPVAGGIICKAGLRTGYTCGQVLDTDLELNVKMQPNDKESTRLEHMFAANVCGQHGDSGGPIFAGTKAVGITSAVAMDPTSPDDGCGVIPLLIGQPINPVLQANPGLSVRTN
ncbi:S1 family peptidase [Nocardia sp. NPDC051570]|uniref:S1 family peptidase n=1 Tax=Nocardia sp. NPDC051570 TaxID=3364324 RepID=UPI0037AE2466